jgi:hypothetical protein
MQEKKVQAAKAAAALLVEKDTMLDLLSRTKVTSGTISEGVPGQIKLETEGGEGSGRHTKHGEQTEGQREKGVREADDSRRILVANSAPATPRVNLLFTHTPRR